MFKEFKSQERANEKLWLNLDQRLKEASRWVFTASITRGRQVSMGYSLCSPKGPDLMLSGGHFEISNFATGCTNYSPVLSSEALPLLGKPWHKQQSLAKLRSHSSLEVQNRKVCYVLLMKMPQCSDFSKLSK